MNWKNFFKKDKLFIGQQISAKNILSIESDSQFVYAIITGREKYELLLKLDLSMIGCSCAYACYRGYCKHVVMLLSYLEQNNIYKIDFNNQKYLLNLINIPTYKQKKGFEIYRFNDISDVDFLLHYLDISIDETLDFLENEQKFGKCYAKKERNIESFIEYLEFYSKLNINAIKRLIFGRILYLKNTGIDNDIYDASEKFLNTYENFELKETNFDKGIYEIRQHGLSRLRQFDSSLRDSIDFIQKVVDEFGIDTLSYVKKNFDKTKISTKNFYIKQLEKHIIPPRIEYIPDKHKRDDDILLKLVELDAFNLKLINKSHIRYMDFVNAALLNNPLSIKYATDEVKRNKLLIHTIVQENELCFRYVDDIFRLDKQFIYENIHNYNFLLECLDYANNSERKIEYFAKQEDIILEIVKNHPDFIKFTENEYKNNYNIAFESVKQDGLLLEYVGEDLRGEISIIKESIKNNAKAYKLISDELMYKSELILLLLEGDFYDNDIMELLYAAPAYIKQNKDYVKKIVEREGIYLQCVSKELQNDKDIALIALANDELAFNYIGESLKNDVDIQKILEEHQQRENDIGGSL